MKPDAGFFPFDLSRAELYWLAGALGIASLPLPDLAPEELSPTQWVSLVKEGHRSLLKRGLLRPSSGTGWQVERLPAGVVRWIASASSWVRLEYMPKTGSARRLYCFTAGEQGLSLEVKGETIHFVLYESLTLLRDGALRWLSLPKTLKRPSVSYLIPQPLVFIPVAWKDAPLATRILKERGAKTETVKSVLDWVASLKWVAALRPVKLAEDGSVSLKPFVFCSDGISLWGGDDEKVSCGPVEIKAIRAKISEML